MDEEIAVVGNRQGLLGFEYEEQGRDCRATAYAGLPLVLEMMRALGVNRSIEEHVHTRRVRREYGFTDTELVESVVLMLSAGGECCEDIGMLSGDEALVEMLGQKLPSSPVLKQFFYRFHDDTCNEEIARMRALNPSYVPEQTEALRALARVNEGLLAQLHKRSEQLDATLDLDAKVHPSDKREAQMAYTGQRGYQPTVVVWAEQDVIVADEFRDGNVPAQSGVLRVLKQAVEALPGGVEQIYFRSDSAAYQHEVIDWCDSEEQDRGRGKNNKIVFAISADISPQLRAVLEAVDEDRWHRDPDDGCRFWCEVDYVPSKPYENKHSKPQRYIGIRVVPRQRELFADGSEVKYFAVVTNDWERDGLDLLRWHRGKAGTVEHVHHVLSNELGAGVLPFGRFNSNAAWYRLNVLTYNVLSAMRRLVLPKQLSRARPKKLRYRVFCIAGQIIRHARRLIVRLANKWVWAESFTLWQLRRRILCVARL